MILSEVLAAQSLPCVLSCPYKNTRFQKSKSACSLRQRLHRCSDGLAGRRKGQAECGGLASGRQLLLSAPTTPSTRADCSRLSDCSSRSLQHGTAHVSPHAMPAPFLRAGRRAPPAAAPSPRARRVQARRRHCQRLQLHGLQHRPPGASWLQTLSHPSPLTSARCQVPGARCQLHPLCRCRLPCRSAA